MGEYKMQSDMYVLPLGRYDVVLSIQWMMTLGSILCDFHEMWMQFKVDKNKYTLKGLRAGESQIISWHHMEKLLKEVNGGKTILYSSNPKIFT